MDEVDLASPLRSLIPSLESSVLEVLAGTETGLSASTIARLAPRGSRQGLTIALDRLVEHGLVIAEPANRGYLYRFNRLHVLAGVVLLALDARLMVIEMLSEAVEHFDPVPVHAALFGSFARSEGTVHSDIDLFLLTASRLDDSDEWRAQVREMQDRVLAATGNRLELLILSIEDLASAVLDHEPIVDSVLTESIRLHGRPLDEVVEDLSHGGRRRRRR